LPTTICKYVGGTFINSHGEEKTPPVTTVREADKAKESKKVSTPPDGAAQSASSERNMSQHDFTVLNMGWRRQALSKGIRNHEMSTERHKFEDASSHHIANEVTPDINVTRELATNGIFGHSYTREIVFVDTSRGNLSVSEITEDLAHVKHLLSTLTSRNIFGFRGREGHAVLTARLPRDSASVEHA
jgi:hypothetical protein